MHAKRLFLMVVSICLVEGISCLETTQSSAIGTHVMSIKEFYNTLQENKLLIDLGKNAP